MKCTISHNGIRKAQNVKKNYRKKILQQQSGKQGSKGLCGSGAVLCGIHGNNHSPKAGAWYKVTTQFIM